MADIELADKTVVLAINRGSLRRTAEIGSALYSTAEGIDQSITRASAKILECDEAKAIDSHYHIAIRARIIMIKALPSPFKSGMYLVPLESISEIDALLKVAIAQHYRLVDALIDVYDAKLEEDKQRLGPVYDPTNYTPADTLKTKLYFTYNWLTIANPAQALPPELAAQEREKLAAAWGEAKDGIRTLLRVNMADLVGKLTDALVGERDGKPGKAKIFRDTKTENILEFCKTFDARNVTNDAELKLLVDNVRTLLSNIPPDLLRKDNEIRELVASEFNTIGSQLESMVVDRPRRRFRIVPTDTVDNTAPPEAEQAEQAED